MRTRHPLFLFVCVLFLMMFNSARAQKSSPAGKISDAGRTSTAQVPSFAAAAEKLVRAAYAKLTRFNKASLLVPSGPEPDLPVEDRYLRFELSNFKVGAIQEILNSAHTELKTYGPGEILQLGRVVKIHNNADPHVAYHAEWIAGQYAPGYDPRWTINDLLSLDPARYHDVGGYALYDVTLRFLGKTRSYRSLVLFHNPYGTIENLKPSFWDSIASSAGAFNDLWYETRPAVGEKGEGKGEGEPNPASPEVPLGRKSAPAMMRASWSPRLESEFDKTITNPTITQRYSEVPLAGTIVENTTEDTREHISGKHGETIRFEGSCSTLSTTEQLCKVVFNFIYIYENGKTSNWIYLHRNRVDHVLGTQVGPRGTPISCYSAHGVATKNCINPDCTFTATLVGSGATMQMTGGDVWRGQLVHGQTCNISKPSGGGGGGQGTCFGSPTKLAKSSAKDPGINLIDPYCCDSTEQINCFNGGGEWEPSTCSCYSPIVIDVAGNGFDLTSAKDGVLFDLGRTGTAEQVSWTAANSDDSWLVLDRNGNGVIDDGKELFGSSTPQPYLAPGESKHGFRALAMFDKAENGGNDDGLIDSRDSVFANLKLWQDVNHNGLSEGGELKNLANSEIQMIELSYKESSRKDENGNWFRYRAKVADAEGAQVGRWAWDVFLQKPH